MPGAALLALSLLAGCGGGGGGDAGTPGTAPSALSISSSNRDDVARTTVAALAGLNLANAVDLAQPTQLGSAALRTGVPSWLPQAVREAVLRALQPTPGMQALAAAAEGRARPQAVLGPFTDNCPLSGTLVTTFNDADNNSTLTAGDTVTVAYNNCALAQDMRMSGQFEVRYLTVTQGSTPAVSATITMTSLNTVDGANTGTLNGRMRLDLVQRSSTRTDTTLTAETDTTLQARTPTRSDTLTLQAGYSTTTVDEDDLLPPEGGVPGRSTLTAQGTVHSSALAGSLTLSTPTALTAYFVDDYPRSGSILVSGRSSSLRLTAVSSTQVRLDLDSNGDGTVDSSSTVLWSSLQ